MGGLCEETIEVTRRAKWEEKEGKKLEETFEFIERSEKTRDNWRKKNENMEMRME